MKDIPDILGMNLEDAEALLEMEGLIFHTVETKPPRPPRDVYENSCMRVIKIEDFRNNKELGRDILVTVCKV